MAASDGAAPSDADRLLADALDHFHRDDHRAALDLIARAREAFQAAGSDERLAACDQREAMVRSDLGDLGEAIRLTRRALAFYEQAGRGPAVAKLNVNLGVALYRSGANVDATRRTWTALRMFRSLGGPYEIATCHENLGMSLDRLGRKAHARRHYAKAVDLLSGLHSPEMQTRRADVLLALGVHETRVGRLDAGQRHYLEAHAVFNRLNRSYRLAMVEKNLGLNRRRAGDSAEAVRWMRSARQRFEASGNEWQAAMCSRLLAKVSLADPINGGDPGEVLRLALDAVRILERYRYRIDFAQLRASWIHREKDAYAVACRAALRANEAAVIAELVESSRQQARPAGGGGKAPTDDETEAVPSPRQLRGETSLSGLDTARNAIRLQGGGNPLGPAPSVSVNGVSAVAASVELVPLERVVARSAGPGGWLWGSFVHGDELWWYLRDPTGHIEAGVLDFGPHSTARRAVERVAAHLRDIERATSPLGVIRRGPLGRRADGATLHGLAELVPPTLMLALAAATRSAPIVVAMAHDPALSHVPWAALALGDDGPHLIERASIRFAPPCGLTGTAPSTERPDQPLVLAVLDPRGDLPNARRTVPERAGITLIGSAATRAGVLAGLRTVEPGIPGVVIVAAHVHQPVPDDALTASIRLADGDLGAADLLAPAGDLGSPQRVVLAGCASAGFSEREWLGVASAFLSIGAATVVAAMWPLLDDPITLCVDRQVVRELMHARSAPDAVRRTQLHAADRARSWWRRLLGRQPLIYHWAAYGAIHAGAADPAGG